MKLKFILTQIIIINIAFFASISASEKTLVEKQPNEADRRTEKAGSLTQLNIKTKSIETNLLNDEGNPGQLISLPEAKVLLEKLDSIRGYAGESFSFELSNVSYKQGELKQRNRLTVQVLNQNSLVEYLSPARQKGRKILKQGSNMWLHLPGTRNTLRITPSQRLLGEASNGDVTGTTFSEDYNVGVISFSKLNQVDTVVLELNAKHREAAYQKVVFYLDPDTYLPLKSDFYSRSDRLLKQAEYKEFKLFNGELKIHKMLLSDPLQAGSFTWMMFDKYQLEKIQASTFHKDLLSR